MPRSRSGSSPASRPTGGRDPVPGRDPVAPRPGQKIGPRLMTPPHGVDTGYMNLRTGLAGLVALVWAIVAMIIGNGVAGPHRIACLPASAAASTERFVSLADDKPRP